MLIERQHGKNNYEEVKYNLKQIGIKISANIQRKRERERERERE
jgi:hypothetical protein